MLMMTRMTSIEVMYALEFGRWLGLAGNGVVAISLPGSEV